jgi:crotonobetainyl-CoA:carnitine CoA-transferase CaiB-like acyl-CoA transferase
MWCLERTKREVWAEARRAKVLCGPLFTMQDLFEDDHFRGRGFWSEVQHPDLGKVTIPGRPFQMERGGWAMRRPAPRLGEHTAEVLHEAGVAAADIAAITTREVPA